jgi:hypothetical protein
MPKGLPTDMAQGDYSLYYNEVRLLRFVTLKNSCIHGSI